MEESERQHQQRFEFEDDHANEPNDEATVQPAPINFKLQEAFVFGVLFNRNSIAPESFVVRCAFNCPNKKSYTPLKCDAFVRVLASTIRTGKMYTVTNFKQVLIGFKGHNQQCGLEAEVRERQNEQLVATFRAHMQALDFQDEIERFDAFMQAATRMQRVPFHELSGHQISAADVDDTTFQRFIEFRFKQ